MEILNLAVFQTKFNFFIFLFLFAFCNRQDVWVSSLFCFASFISECVRLEFLKLYLSDSWPKDDRFLVLPFASDILFFGFNVIERFLFPSSVDLTSQMWISSFLFIIIINVFRLSVKGNNVCENNKSVVNEIASILISDVPFIETFAIVVGAHIDLFFVWIFFCIKMFLFSGLFVGFVSSICFLIFSCISFACSISAIVSFVHLEQSQTIKWLEVFKVDSLMLEKTIDLNFANTSSSLKTSQ